MHFKWLFCEYQALQYTNYDVTLQNSNAGCWVDMVLKEQQCSRLL